jgi:C-terminal processing protease CtpA/Prc
MRPYWLLTLCLVSAMPANSQTFTRQNIATILGFENNTQAGVYPAGWGGSRGDPILSDNQVVHSGKYSARIQRTPSAADLFSTLTTSIPIDFGGNTIQWCGYIKGISVTGYVALWLRQDDANGNAVAFATMQGQDVSGTFNWQKFCISEPANGQGQNLVFGFFLAGPGAAWVDDLSLQVDGVPVALAPPRVVQSSGISLTALSDIQISNLAILGKVWGFLKYHHPAVTSGQRQWDQDLFTIMPQVLAASDQAGATTAIANWIETLGPVPSCSPCASLDTSDLEMDTNVSWISDPSVLGPMLSQTLQNIWANRTLQSSQYYVSLTQGAGNPSFNNESSYAQIGFPDAGYQLLALFRFWNMVQYFYPNRDRMADDPAAPDYWDKALTASIPLLSLAKDDDTYQQELMRLVARIHDTHSDGWSSTTARAPTGSCYLPVGVRFVGGSALVVSYLSPSAGPASGIRTGDIIQQLDGVNVSDLVAQLSPFYADSNQAAQLRDIASYMTRGACGPASVVVERGGERGRQTLSLTSMRVSAELLDFSSTATHDLPGATFQLLSPDVAYLKLGSVAAADSASYIQSAAGTKGLIIDIRNYPSEFVVFTLGDLLVTQPTNFVRFTQGDVSTPSAFHWSPPVWLTPQQPHYSGKIVILVDEITQSQAEYTALAFRETPGAVVIGSTTAGADGNVSTILFPGGLSTYFSGIGVFYPDGNPTQRVGIVPDIVVAPTIAGLRAGRDEVLEAALGVIEGGSHPRRPRR